MFGLTVADLTFRMIAVMSMNYGYLLAVLAGTFIGTLGVGRWILPTEH
jgi:hypothetical protein